MEGKGQGQGSSLDSTRVDFFLNTDLDFISKVQAAVAFETFEMEAE